MLCNILKEIMEQTPKDIFIMRVQYLYLYNFIFLIFYHSYILPIFNNHDVDLNINTLDDYIKSIILYYYIYNASCDSSMYVIVSVQTTFLLDGGMLIKNDLSTVTHFSPGFALLA